MQFSKASCLITLCLLMLFLRTASAAEVKYTDLPANHWAYPAVQALSETGIMTGYGDGTFKPDQKITREQFAVLLVRTLKIPLNDKAAQTFSDIGPDHRSFLYIDAAKSFIPTPSNPLGRFNFDGEKAITREEAAEALALALDLAGTQPAEAIDLAAKFNDYQTITPEFRSNAELVVYYGILSGGSDGCFRPKAGLSRAEFSVVLYNILQKQSALSEALKPPHTPWSIEFINFRRPDYDMVVNYPLYNKTQSFYGKVTSTVYGFNNSHLVVEHNSWDTKGGAARSENKTVWVWVYAKDLTLFSVGEYVTLDYDRNNTIISYRLENDNPVKLPPTP